MTEPFSYSYAQCASKAKTVVTPVMGMGTTEIASWAIGRNPRYQYEEKN